jgi:hypothetical protein
MDKLTTIYLIDSITYEILLVKKQDINKKIRGFLKPLLTTLDINSDDLNRFATLDIETIAKSHAIFGDNKFSDFNLIENNSNYDLLPLIISLFDFPRNEYLSQSLHPAIPTNITGLELRKEIVDYHDNNFTSDILLQNFLSIILKTNKYHRYKIYAHNLSAFDGIYLLGNLIRLSNIIHIKVIPLIRDNKIISIKVNYGYRKDTKKYRYHLEFRDSYLILLHSLTKLSNSFLSDKPELMKFDNSDVIINKLLNPNLYRGSLSNKAFIMEVFQYCMRDCLALAHIISRFNQIIFDKFKLNIHDYPTISSLALAIYRSNYLKSNKLIPLISGNIYNNIKKAYHGGHTDVYKLYSNKPVHSYDYTSMYPTQMLKHKFPVGKITSFDGNPIKTGYTFTDLCNSLSFVKCDVYVDKSLNRPLYQTQIKINGETRSMCATGLFKNQWVFIPELIHYYNKTNGLIKIVDNSIKQGYMFESENIFEGYIKDLFDIKKSVTK